MPMMAVGVGTGRGAGSGEFKTLTFLLDPSSAGILANPSGIKIARRPEGSTAGHAGDAGADKEGLLHRGPCPRLAPSREIGVPLRPGPGSPCVLCVLCGGSSGLNAGEVL